MHWFERRIRQYEHRRWTTDDNRRVQVFLWWFATQTGPDAVRS